MAKDLVIVESPAKARTLERFLGNKYKAKASMGHVRDLPKREMGVSVDDGSFKPRYVISPDKRKVISELKAESAKAGTVYLATDPDREGEAISWHLIEAANIDPAKTKRVAFHEITEKADRLTIERDDAIAVSEHTSRGFRPHALDLEEGLADDHPGPRVVGSRKGAALDELVTIAADGRLRRIAQHRDRATAVKQRRV